jgi:type IV secretion system protein VirB10
MNNADEILEPVNTISQVKTENKWNSGGSMMLWIFIGALVIFLLIMIFSGKSHEKNESTAPPEVTQKSDHQADLQQNLERLKSENVQMKTQLSVLQQNVAAPPAASNEYMARQNAPTSMYRDTASQSVSSASVSEATTSPSFAGQSPFGQFANQNTGSSTVLATHVAHPDYAILSGEFLHAVLETAINSDLPGMVRAIVSKPVYAYTSNLPLIPAGSRLIGQYSSTVLQGQNRVFVIWNRVILPNGISAQINSPGVDALGVAGQGADDVNTHFFARFGQASLLSIIGAGASNYGVGPENQYNSSASYRMAMAQSFQQSAQQSLQSSLQIKPTITIHQGAEINVFVSRDIDFYAILSGRK